MNFDGYEQTVEEYKSYQRDISTNETTKELNAWVNIFQTYQI